MQIHFVKQLEDENDKSFWSTLQYPVLKRRFALTSDRRRRRQALPHCHCHNYCPRYVVTVWFVLQDNCQLTQLPRQMSFNLLAFLLCFSLRRGQIGAAPMLTVIKQKRIVWRRQLDVMSEGWAKRRLLFRNLCKFNFPCMCVWLYLCNWLRGAFIVKFKLASLSITIISLRVVRSTRAEIEGKAGCTMPLLL